MITSSQAAEKGPSALLRETRSFRRTSMYASARGFIARPASGTFLSSLIKQFF
jgi:hypothetical protein